MKKIIPVLLILSSCIKSPVDLSVQSKNEINAADIAMSDLAAKNGFHTALLAYADDSVVKPSEGEFPVIGKTNLEKYWKGKNDFKTLTWEPFKAEASRSGEMGYTIGNWKFVTKDSTFYGNYYTFWKKQNDGNWKFVFDGGNNTPVQK